MRNGLYQSSVRAANISVCIPKCRPVLHVKELKEWTVMIRNDKGEMLSENPQISCQEIGDQFGITRQRVAQIIKDNGIVKQRSVKRPDPIILEKIVHALDRLPVDHEISICTFAKENGICYQSLQKYMDNNPTDEKVMILKSSLKKNVKISEIRRMLRTTNLTCKEIAEKVGSRITYVSGINRRENIRPKRKKGCGEEKKNEI